jgi:5,10-methylene-tetrahydrofolate dehydrogenase/methenyl tetrahydrofolate cyclohydrolase
MKGNTCERIGMSYLKVHLPEETTTEKLLSEIEQLNSNNNICGILLQHPVPKQINMMLLNKNAKPQNMGDFFYVINANYLLNFQFKRRHFLQIAFVKS